MPGDLQFEAHLETKTCTFAEVLRLGAFEPASVQRVFQWRTEEANRLLSDLLAFMQPFGLDVTPKDKATEASADGHPPRNHIRRQSPPTARKPKIYYLGQMLLMPRERTQNAFVVYDGMQRLTTLMILISVLRDTWEVATEPDTEVIGSLLRTADGRPRVQAQSPAGSLARIVGQNPNRFTRRSDASDADLRIHDVQYALTERLEHWHDDQRRQFLELLSERVLISATLTTERPVAYQIFVTTNARGKRLELSEILKGKIAELIDRSRSRGGGENYAKMWAARRREAGRHFDKVLAAAELIRCKSRQPHHPGENLIEELERGDDASDSTKLADDFAAWIAHDLARYVSAFNRIRKHHNLKACVGADITLRRLSFLRWYEWRAVAIMLDERYGADSLAWADKLQELERACFCLELADWGQQGIRELMIEAIRQLESGHDPFRSGGALNMRQQALVRRKASAKLGKPLVAYEQRAAIMRWLETLYWPDRLPADCTDNTHIEHVLPQALKDGWEGVFTETEHEEWVHCLGNLCLLPKDLNWELGAAPWTNKRPAYLDLDEQYRSAADVAKFKTWTSADVKRRHDRVVGMAREALRL
jgi:hypothetical protein